MPLQMQQRAQFKISSQHENQEKVAFVMPSI